MFDFIQQDVNISVFPETFFLRCVMSSACTSRLIHRPGGQAFCSAFQSVKTLIRRRHWLVSVEVVPRPCKHRVNNRNGIKPKPDFLLEIQLVCLVPIRQLAAHADDITRRWLIEKTNATSLPLISHCVVMSSVCASGSPMVPVSKAVNRIHPLEPVYGTKNHR